MCPMQSSRKRSRSDSATSTSSSASSSSRNDRRTAHAILITPEPNSSSDNDPGNGGDADDADESEPEAETSFESPASLSSPSSYASLSTPPPRSHKRVRTVQSPTPSHGEEDVEDASVEKDAPVMQRPLSAQRDEIVAAILTIASALGLTKETLHVCVDLLDRYLAIAKETNASRLETLSIACLWLAVKFMETPETIIKKSIKQILKRRRHSGNWTWHEIIRQEGAILKALNFRLIGPTVLSVLQAKLHADGVALTLKQRQLAFYFADLLLLKDRTNEFSKELLVDAIWFVITGHQIADVQAPLLAPVVILFLAHRDNINPQHVAYKTWFALRCQYGPSLQAPWQLPYDPKCDCRVCEHTEEFVASTTPPSTPMAVTPISPASPQQEARRSSVSATGEASTNPPCCVAATGA